MTGVILALVLVDALVRSDQQAEANGGFRSDVTTEEEHRHGSA